MKIKADERSIIVEVNLSEMKFPAEARVFVRHNMVAMVNFSAMGSIFSEDARKYAKAILKACDIADQINNGEKNVRDF